MAAHSLPRRFLKRVLFPLVGKQTYQLVQSLAKAVDIRTGSWSEPELDLVPHAVREGETVFDIGANYGLYSYHLARAVGGTGRVYAFEPIPFVNETFRRVARILRFQNVELIPKGCSDRTGRVPFTLPLQVSGAISGGLAHIGQRNNERNGRATHFPYEKTEWVWCDVIALDDLFPDVANLSFIKCDIEGAELLAFRGAFKLIQRCVPIVLCEINPWFLEGFGIQLQELLDFFFEKGYKVYRYQVHGSDRQLLEMSAQDIVEDNYLFIHPSRRDRFSSILRETTEKV